MSLKGTAFRPYIIAQNIAAFEATENPVVVEGYGL
jgi:hypothetical protein